MGTILGPTLGPDRPKRGQDEPKRAIRSFKEPKSCIFKNLKKPKVFYCFWIQRPPKRTSRGPRRLPRDTQRDTQRWSKNWSNSGQIVNPKTSKNKQTKNRLPCLQDIFKKPQTTSYQTHKQPFEGQTSLNHSFIPKKEFAQKKRAQKVRKQAALAIFLWRIRFHKGLTYLYIWCFLIGRKTSQGLLSHFDVLYFSCNLFKF